MVGVDHRKQKKLGLQAEVQGGKVHTRLLEPAPEKAGADVA